MKILVKIQLLLLGIWLGAAIFFGAAMAPTAFRVLPNSALAGSLVSHTLTIVNFSGIAIGVLLLLLSFVPRAGSARAWAWFERFLLFVIAAACGFGQAVIGLYLEQLRKLADKPIDQLPPNSSIKLSFDQWHQYSVWILATAMIAAFIAFFVIARSSDRKKVSSNSDDMPKFDLPDELKM
ncbi:MAG: DUF4149 domain-containing protein [Pyrinomonadaceae bacterium]